MLDKFIADLGGVAPQPRKNRFGARTPEADATLPPMTYWDNDQTLPRGPFVGLVIGEQGSHKTGLFIMHGLDAIERHHAHVLYIAAEGAYGIKRNRLPAAREARDVTWETLNEAWRTEDATFDLLNPGDHDLLFEAYGEWCPNLILVDVLTKVAAGDINTPAVAAAIMAAANNLALRFNATVVIAHHPGKDPSKGAMGSNLFPSLADFMWKVWEQNGAVWVKITKMKDGPTDHSHCYVADFAHGAPVVRRRTVGEQMTERAPDPLATAIKAILSKRPSDTFDMGGLIEELIATHGLSSAIKKPQAMISALVADGELDGYVEVRGEGKGARYTFRAVPNVPIVAALCSVEHSEL